MSLGIVATIAGAIVGVALLSVLVSSNNTSAIIKAGGDAFAGALGTAKKS